MCDKRGKKRKSSNDLIINDATDLMWYLQPAFALPEKPKPGENLTERLETIKQLLEEIDSIVEEINKNPPNAWGTYYDPVLNKSIYFNNRIAQTNIDNARIRLNTLQKATDSLHRSQLSLAATTMTPGDGDQRGDGNCYIQTVNIGQGDCTTIATPEGLLILVDMGSEAMTDIKLDWTSAPPTNSNELSKIVLPILLNTVKQNIFLGTTNNIHLLILSHEDADHHNKLSTLGKGMNFGRVYYSGNSLTSYKTTSKYIRTRTIEAGLKKVDLMPVKDSAVITKQINGVTPPTRAKSLNPGKYDSEYVDSTTGAIVLYEEASGFKISVLVSNVMGVNFKAGKLTKWVSNDADIKTDPKEKKFKLDASDPNKRSLVVLVEFNGQKAVITGDATAVTEYFMATQDSYTPLFQDLDMYRLPHHSSLTSSSIRMLNKLTGLKSAVGSCSGKYTDLHRLPQKDILNLYASPDIVKGHEIWTFNAVGSGAKAQNEFKKQTYATGSNGTRIYKFAKP